MLKLILKHFFCRELNSINAKVNSNTKIVLSFCKKNSNISKNIDFICRIIYNLIT